VKYSYFRVIGVIWETQQNTIILQRKTQTFLSFVLTTQLTEVNKGADAEKLNE